MRLKNFEFCLMVLVKNIRKSYVTVLVKNFHSFLHCGVMSGVHSSAEWEVPLQALYSDHAELQKLRVVSLSQGRVASVPMDEDFMTSHMVVQILLP